MFHRFCLYGCLYLKLLRSMLHWRSFHLPDANSGSLKETFDLLTTGDVFKHIKNFVGELFKISMYEHFSSFSSYFFHFLLVFFLGCTWTNSNNPDTDIFSLVKKKKRKKNHRNKLLWRKLSKTSVSSHFQTRRRKMCWLKAGWSGKIFCSYSNHSNQNYTLIGMQGETINRSLSLVWFQHSNHVYYN